MEFFNSAVDVLKTLVVALGAGLGVWGSVNLMEGYGGDNPSANESGDEAAHGWRRCCPDWHHPDPPAERSVRLIFSGRRLPPRTYLLASVSSSSVANGFLSQEETHCKSNIHLYSERTVLLCRF